MMCDVMPTISEDGTTDRDSTYSGDDANFEQLMVNMLDERDKLMETLRESQESLAISKAKQAEIERERDALIKQLQANTPQEYASISKELNQAREHLLEREEEISELKAERNNTRLLLEHLECLVSRHERSLRMTVVKRQASSPAGVSSEVEVLKALKSLFEHHKALDEKVRERLRVALERVAQLEEELSQANTELFQLREKESKQRHPSGEDAKHTKGGPESSGQDGDIKDHPQHPKRLSNGSIDPDSDVTRVIELQETLEKQSSELTAGRGRMSELTAKVAELEDSLASSQKELLKAQEQGVKLQRDIRESIAQKVDQEQRIATLEKRYLNAQRETTSVHDLNNKLESELATKELLLKQSEDKLKQHQEKLDTAEQRLAQSMRKMESLPDVEAELQQRLQALAELEAEAKHGSTEEQLRQIENQLEDKTTELQRALQREKMNEEHNSRLSATVDKLLTESNERLQLHLKERLQAVEEKTQMTAELDKIRQTMDELQDDRDKLMDEIRRLKRELQQYRDQIDKTSDEGDVLSRSQRGREQALSDDPSKVNTLNEQEWEKLQQANVLANVREAFDTSDTEVTDDESIFNAVDLLSPTAPTDAQTLALMLQEQLDAINNEIRLIQEEKETTEQRAEELESRVGSGSLDAMRWRNERSFERSSPPMSGRSTPTPRPSYQANKPDYLQKYNTIGDTPLSKDDSAIKEDQRQIKCESSPPTPRSLRLERVQQALAQSNEELQQRSVIAAPLYIRSLDSSHSTPSPLSSNNSSQDSLHKQPKKKGGFKNSLNRIFSKKEKGKKDIPLRAMHPDAQQAASEYSKELAAECSVSGSASPYVEVDVGANDTLTLGLGKQTEFDRRKKKKVPTATLR